MSAQTSHNTLTMLVSFYGELLAEQEREKQILATRIRQLEAVVASKNDSANKQGSSGTE